MPKSKQMLRKLLKNIDQLIQRDKPTIHSKREYYCWMAGSWSTVELLDLEALDDRESIKQKRNYLNNLHSLLIREIELAYKAWIVSLCVFQYKKTKGFQ